MDEHILSESRSYCSRLPGWGWDGVLPWVAAAVPLLLSAVFGNDHPGVVLALFVPILTALARAAIGYDQIAQVNHGRAPWARQVALAVAIAILFAFEIVSGVLAFSDDAPLEAWLVLFALYSAYLAMIWLALRKPRDDLTAWHINCMIGRQQEIYHGQDQKHDW
jgi:hypothetical protein